MRKLLDDIYSSWPNLIGLAIGFACITITVIWFNHERNYDRFYNKSKSIYRVIWKESASKNSSKGLASTPSPLGPVISNSIPEIKNITRFYRLDSFLGEIKVESDETRIFESNYCFADPSFFSLFDLPFVYGDAEYALSSPNNVVLTNNTAEKYFGSDDPTGKILRIANFGEYIVSGVIQDIPSDSHIKFDFLSPLEPLLQKYEWMNRWNIPHFYTYLEVIEGTDPDMLNIKINRVSRDKRVSDLSNLDVNFQIEPVTDIHFKSEYGRELPGNGKYIADTIRIFTVLALLVLIISCLNFIIIFIAKAFKQRKEIGVRKTYGATRLTISSKYYLNVLTITVFSYLFSILLVLSIFPSFKSIIGIDINPGAAGALNLIVYMALVILFSSLISGLFPALYISSFRPATVFRGNIFFTGKRTNNIKGFVILQFAISLFFIVGYFIYNSQYRYMIQKDLGYKYDNVYCLRTTPELKTGFESFSRSLLDNPMINDVTACSNLPDGSISKTLASGWEGSNDEERVMMNYIYVDQAFVRTLNIGIKEGRDFIMESDKLTGFILNESAVREMGLQDPINKRFNINGFDGRIIGVVKNFNFESLTNKVNPLVIKIGPGFCKYILISIAGNDIDRTMKYIEDIYNTYSPDYNFETWPMDGVVRELYGNEKKSSSLIFIFSLLGILIASIGLFGLIEYSVRLRHREIGIRKSMGADSIKILHLFIREYGRLILISGIIAAPVSFYYYSRWLDNYAFRITFKIWYILGAMFIALTITSLIVISKTIKTSLMSPADLTGID